MKTIMFIRLTPKQLKQLEKDTKQTKPKKIKLFPTIQEKDIQKQFIKEFRFKFDRHNMEVHTLANNQFSAKTAVFKRSQGMQTGDPDLVITHPKFTFYIELKKPAVVETYIKDNSGKTYNQTKPAGKLTTEQITRHQELKDKGFQVFVCYSVEEAMEKCEMMLRAVN